ncbi:ribosome-associated protein [Vibrio parahaemolyticus O1:K58]|uniref:ribosome biogenesis factor YjgA n=1 Tax=Vibrio parahaemolyticus TaxID=670 RepID=UPI0006A6FA5B|nr:ribosome biogenesis factor YjgA [Vibrio parahaemolyticus]EJG0951742.1 ribosome-associated protein [Vibrio parahaemolyticus O1:K58]EHV9723440.1 ribosome-associated protein [Vibrio parahaemolyticus]EIZ1368280.1 ribosome-associated protein [Vibrio parahaemolyticus]EKO5223895.1 ribosome-associated protein [Vibrio parahaemolyticus]EKO7418206.1 ribosome-associated protein [Vibrio parahaemolyticus]
MARKNQKAPWEPEEEIIWVSKSEMKRDMEELQKLGEELVGLKPAVLEKFPLSEDLREAISDAQRFKNEARRRQLQRIGKLMRYEDPEPIQAALDKVRNKHSQATAALHKLEMLRDRVVEEGDKAIDDVMELYPEADRQRLRQLARQAAKEKKAGKPAKSYREIFQILKALNEEEI